MVVRCGAAVVGSVCVMMALSLYTLPGISSFSVRGLVWSVRGLRGHRRTSISSTTVNRISIYRSSIVMRLQQTEGTASNYHHVSIGAPWQRLVMMMVNWRSIEGRGRTRWERCCCC